MATILVTTATGLQGTAVAQELVKANFSVKVLTRDPSKIASGDYQVAEGSFDDPDSLREALTGVDGVYFKLPLIFDKDLLLKYTKNFVEAAKNASLKLIVFNSSILVPEQPSGFVAFDSKLEAEQLLKQSGLPVVYLHPRIYLDNLAAPWSVPAIIEQGVLPVPVPGGQQVSWISLYDLARYTVAAFQRPELAGRTFEVGAAPVNAQDLTAGLSSLLNKTIQYVYVTPDEFEAGLKGAFGDLTAKSISDIYRHLRDKPEDFVVNNNDAVKALGVEPLTFAQWVANVPWEQLNQQYAGAIAG
ncbi:SDR family oxidoreductase [Chitinophaga solisilvae]|uniref:SDR family oxidoreductase n=1 Tax=Chitinophaga solisilvae TaxID=1233460 RepID=UPI00136AD94A|nr:NmrA family NAD(P)-binding protein [Chitinophaga solisilvae]